MHRPTVTEVDAPDRRRLAPLFEPCRYDRVHIDSVLEGCSGRAYADSARAPTVARLDSGAFTMLGGDPSAPGVAALFRLAPMRYVTPQTEAWRRVLQDEFGTRMASLVFREYAADALDPGRLAALTHAVAPGYELERVDAARAAQWASEAGNEGAFESFRSVDDFLERGVGFCLVRDARIVSVALSTARSLRAIDIEIVTVADHRGRGLATVVGARLVAHCLELGIEPCWLAANPASERLARRLGYVGGDRYETMVLDG